MKLFQIKFYLKQLPENPSKTLFKTFFANLNEKNIITINLIENDNLISTSLKILITQNQLWTAVKLSYSKTSALNHIKQYMEFHENSFKAVSGVGFWSARIQTFSLRDKLNRNTVDN